MLIEKNFCDDDGNVKSTSKAQITPNQAREIVERAWLFICEKDSGDFEAAQCAYDGLSQAMVDAGIIE